MNFVVDIGLDWWPSDTSWEVRDVCQNAMVLSGGNYTLKDTRIVKFGNLPPSNYEFVFVDEAGDGLCCGPDNAPQTYTVMYNDQVVVSETGLDIGFGTVTSFGVPCP